MRKKGPSNARKGYCLLKRTHEVFLDYVNFFPFLNNIYNRFVGTVGRKRVFRLHACGCGTKSTYNAIDLLENSSKSIECHFGKIHQQKMILWREREVLSFLAFSHLCARKLIEDKFRRFKLLLRAACEIEFCAQFVTILSKRKF